MHELHVYPERNTLGGGESYIYINVYTCSHIRNVWQRSIELKKRTEIWLQRSRKK